MKSNQTQQRIYLAIALFVVITGQLLTHIYRPFVYANNINDFGFADTIGSLVSVPGFCFFFWSFKKYSDKNKNQHILIAMAVYAFLWESLGLLDIHGTFDWKDMIAVLISGIITFGLKEWIEKRFTPQGTSNHVKKQ